MQRREHGLPFELHRGRELQERLRLRRGRLRAQEDERLELRFRERMPVGALRRWRLLRLELPWRL